MAVRKTRNIETPVRTLHIGTDAASDAIVAFNLTDTEVDDASHVGRHFRKLRPLDSRSTANQSMIVA
jgi:hypothetical protein